MPLCRALMCGYCLVIEICCNSAFIPSQAYLKKGHFLHKEQFHLNLFVALFHFKWLLCIFQCPNPQGGRTGAAISCGPGSWFDPNVCNCSPGRPDCSAIRGGGSSGGSSK